MAAPQKDFRKQVASDSVLSDFASRFPNLLGQKRADVAGGFNKVAKALAGSKMTGTIQFTLRDGRKTRRWCLTLTPGDCLVAEAATDNPDLEIITDASIWAAMAGGKVSPLEAFGSGQVRVRGDIKLARELAKRVKR